MNTPEKLYKYQAVNDYSLKNLKNSKLFFNDPKNFNDPYDTIHDIKVNPVSKTIAKDIYFGNQNGRSDFENIENCSFSKEELQRVINILSQSFSGIREILCRRTNILIEERNNQLSIIPKVSKRSIDELGEIVVAAYYDSLNSVLHELLERVRENNAGTKGVCCFSDIVDDLLMWSYYADGHKGICLEFDTSFDPFTKVHKVNYVPEVPVIDANVVFDEKLDTSSIVESFLATKFDMWSHEREWRIFHKEKNIEFGYKTQALTGVYFGSKVDDAILEIIALIVKGQYSRCKLYKMMRQPNSFKLSPVEVQYKSYNESKGMVRSEIQEMLNDGIRNIDELVDRVSLKIDENLKRMYIRSILDDDECEL